MIIIFCYLHSFLWLSVLLSPSWNFLSALKQGRGEIIFHAVSLLASWCRREKKALLLLCDLKINEMCNNFCYLCLTEWSPSICFCNCLALGCSVQLGLVQTRWSKTEPVGWTAQGWGSVHENRLQMGEINRIPRLWVSRQASLMALSNAPALTLLICEENQINTLFFKPRCCSGSRALWQPSSLKFIYAFLFADLWISIPAALPRKTLTASLIGLLELPCATLFLLASIR